MSPRSKALAVLRKLAPTPFASSRVSVPEPASPPPVEDEYSRRIAQEVAHYEQIFKGRMSQEVPPVWNTVEARLADSIQAATGVRNLYEYVARHVVGKLKVDILGLGSGACGNELDGIAPLLHRQGCEMRLTCVDINPQILDQAAAEAAKRNVPFTTIVQDINEISLETGRYDVIVAYAALHHFIKLDHIMDSVNRSLRPDGIFVTVDIPTRNGYLMWPETREMVNNLWRVLPTQFKFDHTFTTIPTYMPEYPDADYSAGCMECINSEAILPALRKHLTELHFVPAFAIARRFFDTKFGPNYDLNRPLDLSFFEFIMQLDQHVLDANLLKPETFFGAYARKSTKD